VSDAAWPPPGRPEGTQPPPSAGAPEEPPDGGAPRQQPWWLSWRALVWAAVAVVLGVLVATAHKISTDEVIAFCVLIPSVILHEISHGWVALLFGDDTAKRAGRLTLNPASHIDLFGTIILPALLVFSGYGFIGYAKPVPVNLGRLRSPRNQGVLVSLAGPLTNLALMGLAAVLFTSLHAANYQFGVPIWVRVLYYLGLVNLWLAVFNLLPIPPLDGSVLVERALPAAWWPGYLRLRRFSMPVFIVAFLLAESIHVGGVSLIGHLYNEIERLWLDILGLNG